MNSIKKMIQENKRKKETALRDVCCSIGYYFLSETNGGEDYYDSHRRISECHITGIELKGSTVTITTQRPGVIIGSKGSRIDALTKFLQESEKIIGFKVDKIKLKEDRILSFLYPMDPSEY
jgi:hypothetical protein